MSEQELLQCESMLKNLLVPDNNIRNQAQSQLADCLSSLPKKEALSIYSSLLLLNSTDLNVQTYCALILRKIFLTSDKEISNEAVKNFSPKTKQDIKNNILLSLNKATNKSLKKKIAEAGIRIYEGLIENEEKWDEFLKYLINIFNLDLNENNLDNIELGLYILSDIFSFAYDELKEGIPLFLSKFKIYFSSNLLSLKANTVDCVTELLCNVSTKKEKKQFKEIIFNILETTKICLEQKDEENIKICLDSLEDLATRVPEILRKNFENIYILTGKIYEEKNFDEKVREIGFDILITILEKYPTIIDDNKLQILVQSLFKYSMELDQTIDDEWLHPNITSFITDEFIPEHKLDVSCSYLSRLFKKISEEKMMKITSQNIMDLINHSSEKDWKYKYIAYISVAEIMSYIKELNTIEKLISLILSDLNNPNVKIQYASLFCIAELSSIHNPDFQNDYHKKVVLQTIQILSQSTCLRVQLECCDVLDCFIEHMTNSDAALYLKDSLEILFKIFMKNDTECAPPLREGILDVVQEFINATEDEFKQYSDQCLQLLLKYLGEILNKNINKNLIGPLLETISCIGPLSPELFKTHLDIIVNTLIQINLNLSSFTENIAEYLESTWEKIIPNLKQTNSDKIPQIISSLINLIQKNPEMSISSNPENKFDIKSFFDEDNEEENIEKKEIKKKEIKTSETEEFSIFIKILNEFLQNCKQFCLLEQINNLIPISLKLIKYPNSDIQCEISKTLGLIIEILSIKAENINNIHNYSKNFIAEITTQLLKENDFIVITSLLDSMKEIIKNTKLFLTTQEINELTQNILKVFDIVESSRIAKLKQKEETEEEYQRNKGNKDNKVYSDDEEDSASKDEEINELDEQIDEIENVLTSFSEFFGVLFDTHKKYTLEFVDKIIKEYLPKYFKDNSSNFEKNLGVLLVGDMAEYLTQDIIGNIWDDICTILIKYSNHKDDEVRNSACYGLGAFAKSTKNNFEKYYKNIITALVEAINLPIDKNLSKDDKNTKQFAKDNAVSALGKIIQYQEQVLGNDYDNVFNIWLNNLPIKQDDEEGILNNQFLMDILIKQPGKVLGKNNQNLGQIIIILAKAYNTEMSDELLDTNIEQFALGVKNSKEYNDILVNLISKQKGKTLNRIKSLFKI